MTEETRDFVNTCRHELRELEGSSELAITLRKMITAWETAEHRIVLETIANGKMTIIEPNAENPLTGVMRLRAKMMLDAIQ
jgi:hypothetical protein